MQVYLVGGAVRDELLGHSVSERDWVVVGASPQELERQGFKAVGRDFPVFLHPQTHEEYALARIERKTAPGYRGFSTQFSPDVTLEQDLLRRDLTINAMARDADGELVDPYGGQQDLAQRLLRHVSPAFAEDPVRILRIARFAARFGPLGFAIAPQTLALMAGMVQSGEVDALVPERVWREMERALGEPRPEAFFDTLQQCGALAVVLPNMVWDELAREALRRATQLQGGTAVRFAAVLVQTGSDGIASLCERLRVPGDYRELSLLSARLGGRIEEAAALEPGALLDLLEAADALRRPERWRNLLLVVQATSPVPDLGRLAELQRALSEVSQVRLPREQLSKLNGPAIAAALRAARLQRLSELYSSRRRS